MTSSLFLLAVAGCGIVYNVIELTHSRHLWGGGVTVRGTRMNLYVFYLGGNAGKSNIEVHDIQFVAASHPEEAWPALRGTWLTCCATSQSRRRCPV